MKASKQKLPKTFYIFQKIISLLYSESLISSLAYIGYFIDKRHTNIARVNLDLAFGESISQKKKKRIIIESYKNLIRVAFETILLQGISKEKLLSMAEFENEEILINALKENKPIIFVTAHYGNWELGTLAIAAKFGAVSVVGRPLDWKWANTILKATREQFGVKMIPKRKAMKEMITVMKNRGILGLVVDQNTSSKQGILIDFFGHKARHTPSVAILARKFDAIVIPVFDKPIGKGRYKISFYPPLSMKKSEDSEKDIALHTQAQANITEDIIRENPEYWLWLHKRWKNQYKELYEK